MGALHGMMTAYALARICHELFGDVEYAAIDTDRNKYPIGLLNNLHFERNHSFSCRFWTSCFRQCTQLLRRGDSELFDD